MLRKTVSVALFACTLPLAACGGDDAPQPTGVRFAALSDAERLVAVQASFGLPQVEAALAALQAELDHEQDPKCPTRTVSGTTVTYSGGCTTAAGTTYAGRLVAENAPSFAGALSDAPPTGRFSYRFEKFTIAGAEAAYDLDGSYEQSEQQEGKAFESHAALRLGGALPVSVDLSMHCVPEGDAFVCSIDEGSEGTLEGKGRFAVVGEGVQLAGTPHGQLTLTGEDVMKVNLDGLANQCVPVTLDGQPATPLCFPESEPSEPSEPGEPPAPADVFVSRGWSCADGTMEVTVGLSVPADHVEVQLTDGTHTETHALALAAEQPDPDAIDYVVTLVAGQDTAIDCSGDADVSARFTAHTTDGRDACDVLDFGASTTLTCE